MENIYPGDIKGMEMEHSEFFYYPYGKEGPFPDGAPCRAVAFMRTERVNYKNLLKRSLSKWKRLEPKMTKKAVIEGFNYLDIDYDTWEDIEAENEFFRRLFWSAYLHLVNKESKEDDDSRDMDGSRYGYNPFYSYLIYHFKQCMRAEGLGTPGCLNRDGYNFLPASLEAYNIK